MVEASAAHIACSHSEALALAPIETAYALGVDLMQRWCHVLALICSLAREPCGECCGDSQIIPLKRIDLLDFLAEEVRFELTEPCGSSVFKTDAIDHSATLPSI